MHALAPHFRGQVFEGRGYATRLTSATPGIGTCTPPAAPHHPRAHCTASPHRLRVRAAYLPSRPGAGGRGDLQAHGARARHVLATVRAVRVPLPQGAAFSAPHLASSSRPAVARTGQRHAAPGHPVLSRATLAPPPLRDGRDAARSNGRIDPLVVPRPAHPQRIPPQGRTLRVQYVTSRWKWTTHGPTHCHSPLPASAMAIGVLWARRCFHRASAPSPCGNARTDTLTGSDAPVLGLSEDCGVELRHGEVGGWIAGGVSRADPGHRQVG